jgi:alcohol dehydrogenase class IV
MSGQSIRAAGYAWRLHAGPQVIEQRMKEAVDRGGAKRAFVICSPSVNRRTDIVRRIQATLGDQYVGVFDGIEKDSSYASVAAAKTAAEAAGADLLIAVGGGSVLVAVRAVAIYLAETGDPFEIMTQYPESKPAYSPRLMAPKLPIINIPTTPTSAMNRGGSGLKNLNLDHRMEYFDPKTRPSAIFLDDDALLSAPPDLVRSTSTTVFASVVGSQSNVGLNPLAQGDQDTAFRLAHAAYLRLMDELDNPELRQHLALAAFLQNRAEDDGRWRSHMNVFAGNYSVSTALHIRYPHVGQGESTSVVHASAIRLAAGVNLQPARQVAAALGVWRDGMDGKAAADAVADTLESIYTKTGVPTKLRQLDISQDDLINIAKETVKNFNFNADDRFADNQTQNSLKLLKAAW